MGNSRVMFIAAISAVLGLYTLGIKRADSQVQAIPLSHAYKMQAKEIAKSGVGVALQKIIKNGKWIEQATSLDVMGGTLNYTAVNFSQYGYNWAYVYVSGQYKNQNVSAYAWVEQVKPKKWVVKQFSTTTGTSNDGFAGLEQFSN